MSENSTWSRLRRLVPALMTVLLVLVLALAPFLIETFWLQLGLFVAVACVGAIGADLLTGVAGQFSLASGFFIAVGAYGYTILAGDPEGDLAGLGWPPILAGLAAAAIAGAFGAAFSPISGRVRGLYLGVATVALIFIGQHFLFNAAEVTGGGNGRRVPAFEILGFGFTDDPDRLVFGVPFGRIELLWYLFFAVVIAAFVFALNIVRGRTGRAFTAVRVNWAAASAFGVNVGRTRAMAFTLSSVYAGVAGVMLALAYGYVNPESFGMALSVSYLLMIVLGGLGSIYGAVFGAIVITALPEILKRAAGSLPFLGSDTSGAGFGPSWLSNVLFGVVVIVVMVANRGGIADWLRLRR